MYALAFLQGMVFYGPVATLYRQAQGVTVFEITVIEGISLALWGLLEIPWGILADRIGYRTTIVFCSGLYAVSKVVFWLADGFTGFLVERIMLSVVSAGFSGVDSSMIYLSCQGKDPQKAFGIYNSLGMAGLLTAAGVFTLFVKDNYSLAGFLTVISYGAAALLSFGLTEVRRPEKEKRRTETIRVTLKQMFHNRSLILFLIGAAFLSEVHQTITVFLNQVQYERAGLQSSTIGLIYIIAAVLGMAGACSAAITGKTGIIRGLFLFSMLSGVSCIVLAMTSDALLSVAGILTLRISYSLFQPLQEKLQNQYVKSEDRATELSIHSMMINCVAIGMNLAFGALADWNLPGAF